MDRRSACVLASCGYTVQAVGVLGLPELAFDLVACTHLFAFDALGFCGKTFCGGSFRGLVNNTIWT